MNDTGQDLKWIERFIFDKKFWIPRHLFFWAFMYMLELSAVFGLSSDYIVDKTTLIEIAVDMLLVYFHLYYLLPKFLFKKKYSKFLVLSFIALAVDVFFCYQVHLSYCDECGSALEVLMEIFLMTVTLLTTAIAFKTFKYSYQSRVQIEELRQLNLKSDLKNLQDQVNPHFLFNALNSIYVQSKKGSNKVPEAIMQLSELMRYQTYDSQKDFVKLENEINYLNNYLMVEKQRRDNMKVGVIINGDVKTKIISPLIFLPLVENAVKYSQRSDGEGSYVNMKIDIAQDSINFTIVNNKSDYDVNKGKSHGSGLRNLKRRLEILYPDHKLNVSDFENEYFAELHLPLKDKRITYIP